MRLRDVSLVFFLAYSAFAQGAQQPEAFDVASIKPRLGPQPGGGKLIVSGSRLTVESYALFALITFAYNVKPYQAPGASALDHTYYDIVADAGDGRTRTQDEFRPLMQSLLADRFKLRLHREQRQMPVYALVTGTTGSKLKASAPSAGADEPRDARGDWHTSAAGGRAITRSCPNCTMQQFADIIRGDGMDRPVIDGTGLAGTYDIKLTYVPQNRIGPGMDSGPDDVDIFSGIKDLGLRLEPRTSGVEMLIIDHFEKPAEN